MNNIEAYHNGRRAHKAGSSPHACPFPLGSSLGVEWSRGWMNEEILDKEGKPGAWPRSEHPDRSPILTTEQVIAARHANDVPVEAASRHSSTRFE